MLRLPWGLAATNDMVMFNCSDHSLQGKTIKPVSPITLDTTENWHGVLKIDNVFIAYKDWIT